METAPAPVLLNCWKHHLGFIQEYITPKRATNQQALQDELKTIGDSQMDLYHGALSPTEIGEEIVFELEAQEVITPEDFRTSLTEEGNDYQTLILSDNSKWVLRWGTTSGHYIHLHPARYSRRTTRVKASVLKTAIAISHTLQSQPQDLSLNLVNELRTSWFDLSPIKSLESAEHLNRFLKLLHDF